MDQNVMDSQNELSIQPYLETLEGLDEWNFETLQKI